MTIFYTFFRKTSQLGLLAWSIC
eukprot:UN20878